MYRLKVPRGKSEAGRFSFVFFFLSLFFPSFFFVLLLCCYGRVPVARSGGRRGLRFPFCLRATDGQQLRIPAPFSFFVLSPSLLRMGAGRIGVFHRLTQLVLHTTLREDGRGAACALRRRDCDSPLSPPSFFFLFPSFLYLFFLISRARIRRPSRPNHEQRQQVIGEIFPFFFPFLPYSSSAGCPRKRARIT